VVRAGAGGDEAADDVEDASSRVSASRYASVQFMVALA
jgi:hypothetical protein